LKKPH
jgi:hypothetical protein